MKLKVRIGKPSTIKARLKKPTKLRVRFGNVKITSEGYTPPTYEGATIVTPTKASQTLETDGYFVKADIKVNPIPNEYIVPEGVKEITKNGTYDITDKKTAEVNVPIPEGYHDASGIATDPSKVLVGNEFVNALGKQVGTMPKNEQIAKTLSYDGGDSVDIPEGYHPKGYVKVDFEDKTVTPTKSMQIVKPGKKLTLGRVTVQPIPDQYIEPSGTKDITENGEFDVNEFQKVNVQVEAEIPEGYVELPTLTNEGTSADLVAGKELIDSKGQVVSGVIPIKTASFLTASGATVTVPAGLYEEQAAKSVATATQATPSISVSTAGKITASATQSAGYVAKGTKSATKQLTTQAAKTVTPTKSSQTAVASQRYTTGTITVAPIPDEYIIPSGTKAITENGTHDVTEFAEVNVSVEGKEDVVLQSKTVTPTKSTQEVTADANYTALEKVTVNPIPNEYIIPQGSRELTVNYDLYDVRELEAVYVNVPNEIPDGYHDASGITTPTSDVRKGKEFINQDGRKVGTMTEYSNEEIDHILNVKGYPQNMDNIYYPIPNGYHNYSGYVSIEPEAKTATPAKSAQDITPTDGKVLYKVTVNPIPDEYVVPSGELPITENGTYDVTEKASVTVNVEGGGGAPDPSALYQRVDFIQSTTGCKIVTDIFADNETGMELLAKYPVLADKVPMGSRLDSNATRFYVPYPLSANSFYYGFNAGSTRSTGAKANTIYRSAVNFLNHRCAIVMEDSTNVSEFAYNLTETLATQTAPIGIFGYLRNLDGEYSLQSSRDMIFYGARISQGAEIVREYIPCYRKSDGEIGLYEKHTGTFLTNEGTGTFTAGADIKW